MLGSIDSHSCISTFNSYPFAWVFRWAYDTRVYEAQAMGIQSGTMIIDEGRGLRRNIHFMKYISKYQEQQ